VPGRMTVQYLLPALLAPPGAFGPFAPVSEGSAENVTCLAQMCDETRAQRRP